MAVPGPNLETRAEYRFLRQVGADVVGMSTVPEVIVGVHCGLRNLGFSVITDMCLPDALEPAKLADIIATANAAEKKLRVLVRRVVQEIAVAESVRIDADPSPAHHHRHRPGGWLNQLERWVLTRRRWRRWWGTAVGGRVGQADLHCARRRPSPRRAHPFEWASWAAW